MVYLDKILEKIPLVLSSIDREPFSLTYGSGDRVHWCWKFTDFPGARFQEYIYTLSWLVSSKSFDNPYYKNRKIIKEIEAGILYWENIQYSDGSFDEAYPFEKSFAATSFTLFYNTEAFFLVEKLLSQKIKKTFLKVFDKASKWLICNDEHHGMLSNHQAVAASALYNAGMISGNSDFIKRSNYFLNKILKKQSNEGWFEEYGGPDIGYQTHGSFYLAVLWLRSKNNLLLESLKLSNKFIKNFIHPDGSIGGEYASRDTTFYFPAAYEILSKVDENALLIKNHQIKFIEKGLGVGLRQMDSYNLFPMLNNYIFAHEFGFKKDTKLLMPYNKLGLKVFDQGGLIIKSTKKYYAIIGVKKGGIIKIWDKKGKKISFQSCGYFFKKNNHFYSNNTYGFSNYTISNNKILINAKFTKINRKVFNPYLFLFFRVFNIVFGRFKKLAVVIKIKLVNKLINKKKAIDTTLSRKIILNEDSIEIDDSINGNYNFQSLENFSTIHMGSSRYADLNDFLRENIDTNFINNKNDINKSSGVVRIKF